MAIAIECRCGKRGRVKEALAGKRVKCPECGRRIQVPPQKNGEVRDSVENTPWHGKLASMTAVLKGKTIVTQGYAKPGDRERGIVTVPVALRWNGDHISKQQLRERTVNSVSVVGKRHDKAVWAVQLLLVDESEQYTQLRVRADFASQREMEQIVTDLKREFGDTSPWGPFPAPESPDPESSSPSKALGPKTYGDEFLDHHAPRIENSPNLSEVDKYKWAVSAKLMRADVQWRAVTDGDDAAQWRAMVLRIAEWFSDDPEFAEFVERLREDAADHHPDWFPDISILSDMQEHWQTIA